MHIEQGCEDRFELYQSNPMEASLEKLVQLLSSVKTCPDFSNCDGCNGQIEMLERMIAERGES